MQHCTAHVIAHHAVIHIAERDTRGGEQPLPAPRSAQRAVPGHPQSAGHPDGGLHRSENHGGEALSILLTARAVLQAIHTPPGKAGHGAGECLPGRRNAVTIIAGVSTLARRVIPTQARRFQTRIVGGRWHPLATLPGRATAATLTWSYLHDIDQSWGCGASERVVAVRGGQPFEIAGDLRSRAFQVSLAANDDVAFLGTGQKLHRITGKRMEEVADMPDENSVIVAVDAGGAPLTSDYSGLLRWSPRGGWRRLLHVPPPPPAP